MEEIIRFVSLAQTDRFTITDLCEQFGISRKTAYKQLERYAAGGLQALQPRSHRPHRFPQRTGAAEAFERTLGEAATRFGWEVHAYVVMSNHFHLALALTEPNLSQGMKWLQGTWIRRYNGMRGLKGRPFQGRYKALLVEPGESLGKVCHYIHLNPVRAGLVKAAEAARYPWSSLAKFTAGTRPSWLSAGVVLAEAGGLPDRAKGWAKYIGYLAFLAEDEPSKKALAAVNLSRGWCIGGREFKAEVKREHLLRGAELERFVGLEPAVVKAEREAHWEERLGALATAAKVDLSKLAPLKSHPAKVRLAAALKQSTSVSNGWLAMRLQMGQPASASQFVRRWLQREEGQRATALLLSRVKT